MLLSSHILGEVEALCDRVSIVRRGRVVESGSLAQLRHLTRTSIHAAIAGSASELRTMPGIHDLSREGDTVRFTADAEALGPAIAILGRSGLQSLTSQPPTLEDLFLRHYGDQATDPTGQAVAQ